MWSASRRKSHLHLYEIVDLDLTTKPSEDFHASLQQKEPGRVSSTGLVIPGVCHNLGAELEFY